MCWTLQYYYFFSLYYIIILYYWKIMWFFSPQFSVIVGTYLETFPVFHYKPGTHSWWCWCDEVFNLAPDFLHFLKFAATSTLF